MQTEGRQASRAEQQVLARFTGWGAGELANNLFGPKLDQQAIALEAYKVAVKAFDANGGQPLLQNRTGFYNAFQVLQAASKSKAPLEYYTFRTISREQLDAARPDAATLRWLDLRDRLKAALTSDEWAEASRSTQYAHYTSKAVVQSMWRAMERMGFKGGSILEPGAGIGVFPGLMPSAMANNSVYTGIEFDGITGGILKQLFPDERILVESFVDSKLPKNFYDVAAGNPPFSGTKILGDPEYAKLSLSLHDYFFAKSLDRVKPGGLVMFVTSRYTMDKLSDKARSFMAERADLVGAIRLPQTAFKQNAGTDVVTDVIFLRKKVAGEAFAHGQDWLKTGSVSTPEGPALINEYFVAHPEMVLGKHSMTGKMQNSPDPQYTVLALAGDIEAHFAKAVENLPGIVGFGVACELAQTHLEARNAHTARLRDRLEQGILQGIPGTRRNGHRERRVPNTLSISFEGLMGADLLMNLDLEGIAVSLGAACSSESRKPSPVLLALGRSEAEAKASLRFSLGEANTEEDILRTLEALKTSVMRLRARTV